MAEFKEQIAEKEKLVAEREGHLEQANKDVGLEDSEKALLEEQLQEAKRSVVDVQTELET